jgi:hypothetical protein
VALRLINGHSLILRNEQSCALSGKPTTASTSTVTVKNTDKSGAAVTKTYDLKQSINRRS